MSLMAPHRTDKDIVMILSQYDECSFTQLPSWLRLQLQVRDIKFPRREPTEYEQWETVSDAREHRITNNEKTLEDYKDKYLKGKPFHIF